MILSNYSKLMIFDDQIFGRMVLSHEMIWGHAMPISVEGGTTV